jgi:predicted FMN-binding regulatory protein PaiB
MRDLEDMAAKLDAARKLPPGRDRHAMLEQIVAFRIKLAAMAAKRKLLQSAKLQLAALVRANDSRNGAVAARDVRL